MSDIRELLRTTHVCEDMAGAALALIHEQDAEIVRLRAENEKLREAIGFHFAQHRPAAVIINDDGELQVVHEVIEGDDVIWEVQP